MKLIIATIVLAVLVAFAPQAEAVRPIQEARCVLDLINSLENAAAAEQAWIRERQARFAQLEEYRENCENLIFEFLRKRCLESHEALHKLEVALTLKQISDKKAGSPELVARLLRNFEQCRA